MIDHNRIYLAALLILCVMAALGAGFPLFLAGASAGGSIHTNLPDAPLPWLAGVNAAYAMAIGIVICARWFRPASGRRLARILNWALLPAVPGGTVVEIYGLLRADKGFHDRSE